MRVLRAGLRVACEVRGVYAPAGAYSGVGLVLRSRQFPTFAFNSSKKFRTRRTPSSRNASSATGGVYRSSQDGTAQLTALP